MAKLNYFTVAATLLLATTVSASHMSEGDLNKRTAPDGKVYIKGQPKPEATASAAVDAKAEQSEPASVASAEPAQKSRSGADVYNTACVACHGSGVAGAPKFGDIAAWKDRIAKGEDKLFEHAINGFQGSSGMMPPKGGCVACSDDEIKAAVVHIMLNSQ